ncbi:MAG: zinc-ribbon domain-containing protein [Methanomassiliicoccales archaeon]|nr:zinc-ribbon domain-containing protein [Methanomassiliicoccales archaeon]
MKVKTKGVKNPPRKDVPRYLPQSPKEKAKPRSMLTQVQHDAVITGGTFTIIGGVMMFLSIIFPWIGVQGETLGALDLLDLETMYFVPPIVPMLGALLVTLSCISVYRAFRPGKERSKAALLQALLAMIVSLLVIFVMLQLQKHYEGQDAFYDVGAFLNVIGAILVMSGSLLMQAMSGRVVKKETGFKALAQRSMAPAGKKGWEPPESSVKAPRCPSCGEELRPGWKACPACGYALVAGDRDHQDSL